jgi:hypothetical protein
MLAGIPIARINSEGGLEDIGTGLVIIFSMVCAGAALGATLALAVTRRERAVVTGALVLPSMVVGVFIVLVVVGRLGFGPIVLFVGLIVVAIVALWLSRALAVLSLRSGNSSPVRED